tara:strand:+ start:496 stop:1245 length:750 start_codon:yes stop_codon:yes gene_type:complete
MKKSFEKKLDDLKFQLELGVSEAIDLSISGLNRKSSLNKIKDKSKDNSNNSLDDITSLEDLKLYIEQFEGCELKLNAKNTVFCDGNKNSKIMIIGEAPGNQEDIEGKPFVGKSGQLLDKVLNFINLNRGNCYITNIVPWRPPGNRNPTSEELKICVPFVKKHIELIKPDILLLVGSISTKSLLNIDIGITKIRGEWKKYQNNKVEIPSLPIFHPAYLLRRPTNKSLAMKDMLVLNKKIKDIEKEKKIEQ